MMTTLFSVQLTVGVVLLLALLARYVRFFPDLVRFLLDYPGQALILVLLYALVLGQVGTGFGIPYLFWNEDPQTRLCAAGGATLLLGLVGINAYQLIPQASQSAVMKRVRDFTARHTIRLRPLAFLEPPAGTNAWEISHFLRLVRLPFLTLLAAPALLPGLFPTVPRFVLLQAAPAGSAGVDVRCVSVTESLSGYLVGLASWLGGILAGILLLKIGIRVCAHLAPTLNRLAEDAGAALEAIWDRARSASIALGIAGEPGSRRDAQGKIAPRKTGALAGFFGVVLATYLLLALASFLPDGRYHSLVSPGLAICALLVLWVGAANHDAFKPRFENLPKSDGFLLSTAARMSASFSYVSPAVNLPSQPPLRVVDAGYYDNYGINVALAWVAMNRLWLIENTSGVVVVQIRDALSWDDRFGYPASQQEDIWSNLLTGFEFLTSVPDAVLQARRASTSFRNDKAIAEMAASFTRATGNRDFFITVIFENSANVTLGEQESDRWPGPPDDDSAEVATSKNVAMTWCLTHFEKRALETAIPPAALASGEFADRTKRLARIQELKELAARAKSTSLRGYLLKQYERARHYERVQALKAWWGPDHAVRSGQGSKAAAPSDTGAASRSLASHPKDPAPHGSETSTQGTAAESRGNLSIN